MASLSEIFSESPPVKADGGVFIPHDNDPFGPIARRYLAAARHIVVACNQNCTNQPLLPTYMGLTNSEKINPKAFRYKNVDFIAISWGTIGYLYYFFHLILSFPEILEGIADSQMEKAPVMSQLKLNNSLIDLLQAANPMASPKSEQRKQLAVYCSNIAFQYVLYHEIAHIRHGHIGLLSEARDTNRKISKEDRYAMEYDADCFASANILNYMASNENLFKEITFPAGYTNRENVYLIYFFSVYMFFRVYVDMESVYGHYSQSHPTAYLRMQLPFSVSGTAFLQYPFLDIDQLKKAGLRVVREGELAAALLTDRRLDISGIMMATSASGMKMLDDLEEYWKTLRPSLLCHAYSEIPS